MGGHQYLFVTPKSQPAKYFIHHGGLLCKTRYFDGRIPRDPMGRRSIADFMYSAENKVMKKKKKKKKAKKITKRGNLRSVGRE